MKCPYCEWLDSKVIDSRPAEEGLSVRRRRECNQCGKRFTTYEKLEATPVLVVKKDGRREAFDTDKILKGVMKACEKRAISIEEIERLVRHVEKKINVKLLREVKSEQIGEMIMDELSELDEVAYVRFASVYRQFKDINTFMEELNKLIVK
jgi:transcriptional repressor NrdR